jgi:hypothetical protein
MLQPIDAPCGEAFRAPDSRLEGERGTSGEIKLSSALSPPLINNLCHLCLF